MSAAWTQQQDDLVAFEEAMEVADISARQIERCLSKLRHEVESLRKAETEHGRDTHHKHALTLLSRMEGMLATPPLTQWRQRHSEGRGKRHSQQHVLEVKLEVARALLTAAGIDLDLELAKQRRGS